jgi:hypothetical protein
MSSSVWRGTRLKKSDARSSAAPASSRRPTHAWKTCGCRGDIERDGDIADRRPFGEQALLIRIISETDLDEQRRQVFGRRIG